jgi:hypothetical protein
VPITAPGNEEVAVSAVQVSVHPEKLALLARATVRSSMELHRHGTAIAGLLEAHGEPAGPGLDLVRSAHVLAERAQALGQVLASLWLLEAHGGVVGGLHIRTGPVTAAHREPARARAAAHRAARAHREGNRASLLLAAWRWRDDPVFSAMLLHAVGHEALVDELGMLAASWDFGHDDPGRRAHLGSALVLAGALAAASRHGDAPWHPTRLATTAQDRSHGVGVLGLLGLVDARWDDRYLAALVDASVVPVNRALAAGESADRHVFGGWDQMVDARVVLLARVATQVPASRHVGARSDLGALLDRRAGYLDDGSALGDLLVAATLPREARSPWSVLGSDEQAELARNVERVVHAVDGLDTLAPGAHDRLGAVAGPWIAAFGSQTFDTFGLDNPIPSLDGAAARRFLDTAMASDVAATDLWSHGHAWSSATLAALGPAPDPVAAKRMGNIMRVLTDASHAEGAARAADLDADEDAQRQLWTFAIQAGAAVGKFAPPPVSALASGGGFLGSELVDKVAADGDHELTYLRDLPEELSQQQRALEYLSLAVLWDQRERNGLFAPAAAATTTPTAPASPTNPAAPAHRRDVDRARSLIDTGLLDGSGRLVAYPDLDEAGRRDFDRWLLEENRRGSRLAALLDGIGESFGKSGAD